MYEAHKDFIPNILLLCSLTFKSTFIIVDKSYFDEKRKGVKI